MRGKINEILLYRVMKNINEYEMKTGNFAGNLTGNLDGNFWIYSYLKLPVLYNINNKVLLIV